MTDERNGERPHNVDESAAEPTAVDYPVQSVIRELPAETTTAEGVEDTGYIWDQNFPGDESPMPPQNKPIMRANRVTDVSDYVVFGQAQLAPSTPPFILIPGHRDRLRVTIQADYDAATPSVYLGNGPDIAAGDGFAFLSDMPFTIATRDAIWCVTGAAGTGVTRVQWVIELVKENCGCE